MRAFSLPCSARRQTEVVCILHWQCLYLRTELGRRELFRLYLGVGRLCVESNDVFESRWLLLPHLTSISDTRTGNLVDVDMDCSQDRKNDLLSDWKPIPQNQCIRWLRNEAEGRAGAGGWKWLGLRHQRAKTNRVATAAFAVYANLARSTRPIRVTGKINQRTAKTTTNVYNNIRQPKGLRSIHKYERSNSPNQCSIPRAVPKSHSEDCGQSHTAARRYGNSRCRWANYCPTDQSE